MRLKNGLNVSLLKTSISSFLRGEWGAAVFGQQQVYVVSIEDIGRYASADDDVFEDGWGEGETCRLEKGVGFRAREFECKRKLDCRLFRDRAQFVAYDGRIRLAAYLRRRIDFRRISAKALVHVFYQHRGERRIIAL